MQNLDSPFRIQTVPFDRELGAPLTEATLMAALQEIYETLPPPTPIIYMSQEMKDDLDRKAGDEAPLTHIRSVEKGQNWKDAPLREIRIFNDLPPGVTMVDG